VLTVTGGGRTATFKNVGAQFGTLVTPTATPKVGAGGTVFVTYGASRLSAAQSRALKGPIRSMSLHLVIAGSPLVNATYRFAGVRDTGLATANPGVQQITFAYTKVSRRT
jgi:hypothetical protein